MLFALFVLYKESPYQVTIMNTMIDTNATIVFMPLYKSLYKQVGAPNQKSASAPIIASTNTPKKSIIPVMEKTKAGTFIASAVSKPVKKKSNTIKTKKTVPKKQPNKVLSKEISKEPIKTIKKEIESELKKENNSNAPVVPLSKENSTPENTLLVGQEQMNALQIQEHIQQVMVHHWHPPANMGEQLVCIIKVMINSKGGVEQVVVTQSSGAPLFDTSACVAASKLEAPAVCFGKELLITFKP